MTEILDGKLLSFKIRENIKKDVEVLKNRGISPCLAVIVVGYNKASLKYVSFKEKACKELGIESMIFKLPENTEEINLIKLIEELNNNQRINGILIQLPLPSHLDQNAILEKSVRLKM